MKISYIKDRDDSWSYITQLIRSENESDNELLKECFTEYTKEQINIKYKIDCKLYSAWLSSIKKLRTKLLNKWNKKNYLRVLDNRNTFYLLK